MNEILTKTIKEVSELLDQKKISSVELTKMVFEHVKKVEPKVKAFITLTEKEALEQACESDKNRRSSGLRSLIEGIPISIKDILCTKGVKTTAGSKMLEDFVPPYDATVVKRLKDAGAVIIGKTNLDAWGHGSSTENSDFGSSKNPWNLERVPGGSSGGSAAAVACGMGFASIGTDTGGSIRQPAALCGITGLKTTYGRNSRYGYITMASSTDTVGPMTRSAEDAAILLEIVAGHDPLDSTTVPKMKFSAQKLQVTSYKLQGLKIGLPKEYFAKGLDSQIAQKIEEAKKVLEKLGAKFVKISLPMTDYGLACYYIIQPAEVSSNLARFDGIKYGYSVEKVTTSYDKSRPTCQTRLHRLAKHCGQAAVVAGGLQKVTNGYATNRNQSPAYAEALADKQPIATIRNLQDVYNQSRAQGFGAEAKRRIMMGTYVLSAGYYDAYYKKAMKVRTLVIADFKKAFSKVDAILTPTTPTSAFKFGEKTNDPIQMYLEDIYTVSANIAGICGISVPCGFVEKVTKSYEKSRPTCQTRLHRLAKHCGQAAVVAGGLQKVTNGYATNRNQSQPIVTNRNLLPVGMQLLGPQFGEETILSIAQEYQQQTNWHKQMPEL